VTLPFTGERYVPSVRGQIAYEHLHRYALAVRFAAGKRVLDVASGEGYGAALLARVAAGVVGVDADAAAVDHGRQTYYASNLRFVQGSCTELPIADGSVDVVVSFETIEHVAEHDRMLDEVRRVLAPGGVLILSSPNKLTYSDLPGYANPFHVKELYFSELRDLLVRRFAHVHIFGQRLAALSLVHPLAGQTSAAPAWYSGAPDRLEPGLPTVEAPLYFIAVASDAELDGDLSSAFLDPHDDLLQHIWDGLDGLRAAVAQPLPAEPAINALGALSPDAPSAVDHPPAAAPDAPDELAEQAELAGLRAELTALRAELRAAGERERGLAGELAGEAGRADALAATAADLEARLAEESLRARTLRATADGLSDEVARARAEAQAAAADVGVERARSAQAAREASALREIAAAEQARTAAALTEAAGHAAALREVTVAAGAERAALQAEVGALGARLAGAESALAASAEALARAELDSQALRRILASHSWRLTEPLRRAISRVRR
jgi:ubiquinone/menaquinone biosynthesis C-methylase UbiE